MRCWRCGQEVADGTSFCIACGASLERAVPTSDAGCAMRALFDRYGADAVLGDPAYLGNGLGDLLQDSSMLRSRLRMAIDAGVGRLYLEQIRGTGIPDAAFAQRVRTLLVGEAGLSDAAASEVASLLDEMVGWQAVPAKKTAATQPQGGADASPFALVEEMTDEEKARLFGRFFDERAPGTNGSQERFHPTPATNPAAPLKEPSKASGVVKALATVYELLLIGGGGFLVYCALAGEIQSPAFFVPVLAAGILLLFFGIGPIIGAIADARDKRS